MLVNNVVITSVLCVYRGDQIDVVEQIKTCLDEVFGRLACHLTCANAAYIHSYTITVPFILTCSVSEELRAQLSTLDRFLR